MRWITEGDLMEGYIKDELVFYAPYRESQYRLRIEGQHDEAAFVF